MKKENKYPFLHMHVSDLFLIGPVTLDWTLHLRRSTAAHPVTVCVSCRAENPVPFFLPSPVTLLAFYSLLNSDDCDPDGGSLETWAGRQVQKEIIINRRPRKKERDSGKRMDFLKLIGPKQIYAIIATAIDQNTPARLFFLSK